MPVRRNQSLADRLCFGGPWRSRCEIYNNVNGGVRRENRRGRYSMPRLHSMGGRSILWPALHSESRGMRWSSEVLHCSPPALPTLESSRQSLRCGEFRIRILLTGFPSLSELWFVCITAMRTGQYNLSFWQKLEEQNVRSSHGQRYEPDGGGDRRLLGWFGSLVTHQLDGHDGCSRRRTLKKCTGVSVSSAYM